MEDKEIFDEVVETTGYIKTKAEIKKINIVKQLLLQIFISVVIFFILINYVLIPCVVDGTSMYPTLHENDFGYSFIISKLIKINRFDIAVIQIEDKLLVKRVIGLPNEKISYIEGKLYINDEYVEENFLEESAYTNDFEVELGEDEYYCLGDNRSVSRDSRYYGPFNEKDIVSTHLFVIKPFANFGLK